MKNNFKIAFLLLLLYQGSLFSQKFEKLPVSKESKDEGIVELYLKKYNFEEGELLILYVKGNYFFKSFGTSREEFNKGKWTRSNDTLYLRSAIINTNIPVKLAYLNENDSNYVVQRTLFRIPVNLKKEKLSDSRIFINNDTTYCFPYFDTCTNAYQKINRIKIDFGDGFQTKWLKMDKPDFKQLISAVKAVI